MKAVLVSKNFGNCSDFSGCELCKVGNYFKFNDPNAYKHYFVIKSYFMLNTDEHTQKTV